MIGTADFLALAARESSRYGEDSWVFVRELLQNARDANASAVAVNVWTEGGREFFRIDDDGEGLTWAEAKAFLLTLHASNKVKQKGRAGKYGVGFWSVFRFAPEEITLQSKSVGRTSAWEVVFSADLKNLKVAEPKRDNGTTVILSRKSRGAGLERQVYGAIRKYARHLRRRGNGREILAVTVNGRIATEPMTVGSPGLSFRAQGISGTVALGSEPEIEVFAHGLLVRRAATIEDLLLEPGKQSRKLLCGRCGEFSPKVAVDSDRLAVLAARGDVAQDRELERVAKRVRREVHRLMMRELDRLAPRSFTGRFKDALRGIGGPTTRRVAGFTGLVTIAAGAGFLISSFLPKGVLIEIGGPLANERIEAFTDRAERYGGPIVDPIGRLQLPPDIRYRPIGRKLWLAAFRVTGLDSKGRPLRAPDRTDPNGGSFPVDGQPVFMEVGFRSEGGILRLPVPSGSVVDPDSILVDGQASKLWRSGAGEPYLEIAKSRSGRVSYRTFESADPFKPSGSWPELPEEIEGQVSTLRNLAPRLRVSRAVEIVRERVRTTRSSEAARKLQVGMDGGSSLCEAALEAGQGDCDVVNAVLAALMHRSGLEARLAVGWLGEEGRALPGLHAWVEVNLGDDRWLVADASSSVTPLSESTAGRTTLDPLMPTEDGAGPTKNQGTADLPRRLVGVLRSGVIAAIALGLVGVALLIRRERGRRTYSPGRGRDSSLLLGAFLLDRERWLNTPSVWQRPLIASVDGRIHSLAQLEKAAHRGRLFSVGNSHGQNGREAPESVGASTWVVDRAVSEGALVIDASEATGAEAARALGAIELEEWFRILDKAGTSDFSRAVEQAVSGNGFVIRLFEVEDALRSPRVLSLGGGHFVAVVGRADPSWERATNSGNSRRSQAVFCGAELVLGGLGNEDEGIRSALAALARGAVEDWIDRGNDVLCR